MSLLGTYVVTHIDKFLQIIIKAKSLQNCTQKNGTIFFCMSLLRVPIIVKLRSTIYTIFTPNIQSVRPEQIV